MDCSPFLNWQSNRNESGQKKAIFFRSLVATVKLQPVLDDSLEAKAVKFLESVDLNDGESPGACISIFASNPDNSSTNFVQSIVVLLSSPSQTITTAAMKIVGTLFERCSLDVQLDLVKVNLISQLITSLNPQSLSFTEGVDIHTCLIRIIFYSFWRSTPYHLTILEREDPSEQQAVYETVLKQVVAPSEQYIRHLCVNRYSIMAGDQSKHFLVLLISLLRISSYYQRTREFVHQQIILTIPSCLAFFEDDLSIRNFPMHMNHIRRELNEQGGENHQMWKKVHRMLIMEGIEDVIEEKLKNDRNAFFGGRIVVDSMTWNNLLGMNLSRRA